MPATTVRVTEQDILEGVAGNCHRCAVAIATARATGGETMVSEDRDWALRIEVDGRSVVAPRVVREFIHGLDDQPRDDRGRPDIRHPDCALPGPIAFELPDPSDPRWESECDGCHGHFDRDELDDDDLCEDCRETHP